MSLPGANPGYRGSAALAAILLNSPAGVSRGTAALAFSSHQPPCCNMVVQNSSADPALMEPRLRSNNCFEVSRSMSSNRFQGKSLCFPSSPAIARSTSAELRGSKSLNGLTTGCCTPNVWYPGPGSGMSLPQSSKATRSGRIRSARALVSSMNGDKLTMNKSSRFRASRKFNAPGRPCAGSA